MCTSRPCTARATRTFHKNYTPSLFGILRTRTPSDHGKNPIHGYIKLYTNEARVESVRRNRNCVHHTYRTFDCIATVELTTLVRFCLSQTILQFLYPLLGSVFAKARFQVIVSHFFSHAIQVGLDFFLTSECFHTC